jgi:hypothetical protein
MKVLQSFTFPEKWSQLNDLRLPQARVLRALIPTGDGNTAPVLTRIQLAQRLEYSLKSGTITRALHGIHPNSPSGSPHQGLLQLGLVEEVELDGIKKAYQITRNGCKTIENLGELPKLKDKASCTNYRYLFGETLGEDLDEIDQQQNVDLTTKMALRNARLGQGTFRTRVLRFWGNCCSVTGSKIAEAIQASHIKPWRESSNSERLDPNNGLPLIASLHSLFDAGLISFDSSGMLLASANLTKAEQEIFGTIERSLRKKPNAKMVNYLAHHRLQYGFTT